MHNCAPLERLDAEDNHLSTCVRLDERKRRKEFILSRGLLNVKRQQALDRKRSKEEREVYSRARVFMRYHSQEEHEQLIEGFVRERKLRKKIEELQVCSWF